MAVAGLPASGAANVLIGLWALAIGMQTATVYSLGLERGVHDGIIKKDRESRLPDGLEGKVGMRGVVYEGAQKVAIKEVEDARIEEPTDVLMRVTSSAMCGSDLHMYDGRAGAEPELVLGTSR
ncbi:MAG: alcohol dehydrogenase catalytic domain-containing protein [Rubrobacter sp.]|nr:alcohol dehydrogenase catalytic domain-containing protein [Rubrobacter sp.]